MENQEFGSAESIKEEYKEIKIYLVYDRPNGPQRIVEFGEVMEEEEIFLGVRAVLKKENDAVVEYDEFCSNLSPKNDFELGKLIENLSEEAKKHVIEKALKN